ncbi:hypothetical protein CD56_01950 [Campylobacter lari]|uniref:TIGR02757 family protein n=1 Tax=Campylobacter lari TaxID=201 RepID=UPI0006401E05|nr:TIGR02757 family protein [Campylobacter lari]AKJ53183.1 hypothetical protein CD56_01950 [Campylobacter lari]
MQIKALLDEAILSKNTQKELFSHPDPLQIASIYKDETIALLCALFAYGNAKNIVNFLKKLDFSLLERNDEIIKKECKNIKYRFQNSQDIAQIFITLKRLKNENSIENIFTEAYQKEQNITQAIKAFMEIIYKLNPYKSYGYEFFFSKEFKTPKSPLKRYNMYLRWMVRKDELDLGLFKNIDKKDLLIPLDTHTHKVSLKLKLLKRKIYDFKSVLELTQSLKKFDPQDPIKYDFALYRIGQNKESLWGLN